MPGVIRTRVGFTGGSSKNPTYHNLSDHTETIDIDFDPTQVTYEELLDIFWKDHNPTLANRAQYMSAIFYHGDDQRRLAEQTMGEVQDTTARKIATKILPAHRFYNAEDYHQKYMLRQHPSLLKSLVLSEKELITSHVAARLNGYLSKNGSKDDFEQERAQLGLNTEQSDYVKRQFRGSRY